MMRVDREADHAITAPTAEKILAGIARSIDEVDLVLISDYNKGVCKGPMIPRLVETGPRGRRARAGRSGERRRLSPLRGLHVHHAQSGRGEPRRGHAHRHAPGGPGGRAGLLEFGVQSVVVTLDRDGMAWLDCSGRQQIFPARPRQVCDITGAGDMVLAVLGYLLAAGADPAAAIEIANVAGGLEVERLGVVPLGRGEILAELARHAAEPKILAVEPTRGRGAAARGWPASGS